MRISRCTLLRWVGIVGIVVQDLALSCIVFVPLYPSRVKALRSFVL